MKLEVGKKYRRVARGNMPQDVFDRYNNYKVTITKITKITVFFEPELCGYTRYDKSYFSQIMAESVGKNKIGGKLC